MSVTRVLAAVALGLGVLAAVAGSPERSPRGVDVGAIARMVAREEDHVTAVELAQWIRDRKPGLRVIDIRTPAEFNDYHIPTAENVDLPSLATLRLAASDTAVLYSDAGTHGGQAWVLLRAAGNPRVFFLRGGIVEWLEDVMDPVLADDATPAEKAAFDPIMELSRYFGGTPHLGPRRADAGRSSAPTAADAIAARKRRGC